jgi:hypothetical protein
MSTVSEQYADVTDMARTYTRARWNEACCLAVERGSLESQPKKIAVTNN